MDKLLQNKTRQLEVQKKLNRLITKDHNFCLVEFLLQVMIDLKTHVYQPTHDTLEFKKVKGTDYILS